MALDTARETALKILYDIDQKGAYSNISVNKYLEASDLREIDRAFVTELVYGTVKWLIEIDYIIGKFSSIKLKKLSPWILNTLRLGVYQVIHTDKIPVSAACNTSVDLAKRYGHQASSRYVNAVLRAVAKNKLNLPFPEDESSEYYLSIKYSHPEWLVKRLVALFGVNFTKDLLKANNEIADFSVRVNTLKTTADRLIEILSEEGVNAVKGNHLEEAVVLHNPSSISRLKAFREGLFQVQDESSMLCARVLSPNEGSLIIDVCSAPGGKTTHMAQLMKNKGSIIARDIHQHKLRLIEHATQRLGINIISTQVFDATQLDNTLLEKADKVLVDAPCSGLGIIRRKPDIKYTRVEEDSTQLKHIQKQILSNASKYVKPGGELVYSTCTILPEENLDIINDFIKDNPSFEMMNIENLLPATLRKETARHGYIQLFPSVDSTDGFFICKMKRT